MKRLIITCAILSGAVAYAGGFRVSLQGVKQLAMAHTSAHAEDASVAFFNPGGISFIPAKLSVAAGGFAVMSTVTYQNPSTLENFKTKDPTGTPFYAAIAYKATDKLSLGFTATTPFGSTIQWPNNWAGSDVVQRLELKAVYLEPMISVKLAPWVSLGVSYIHAMGSVDWTKSVTLLNGTSNLKDDKAKGDGYGFGFYFQPDKNWDVSVAYRSGIDMKANGTFTLSLPNAPQSSGALFNNLGLNGSGQDSFRATLPLASEYIVAATYKITPKWLVSADFNYHGWGQYEKLTLDFANAKLGNQADPTVLVSNKEWRNTKTFRIGTQYMFNDFISGRLGYYYDESPYDDAHFVAETPSFDSNVITGGLGFRMKNFGIDVAAAQSFPKARQFNNKEANLSGQAKATSTYVGLGVSYNAF